jgi:hypothetical protein
MMALRTAFLTLHVAGGVAGLLLGAFVLRPPEPGHYRLALRRGYTAAIAVLVAFLTGTVLLDWTRIDAVQHIVHAGLIGLAAVIAGRVYLAFRVARNQPDRWQASYMNHIYFTYISLWEGFFIVGLLDLKAPAWLVGVVAVGVVLLGALGFNNYKRQVVTAS